MNQRSRRNWSVNADAMVAAMIAEAEAHEVAGMVEDAPMVAAMVEDAPMVAAMVEDAPMVAAMVEDAPMVAGMAKDGAGTIGPVESAPRLQHVRRQSGCERGARTVMPC
jgi:hypothetical protein